MTGDDDAGQITNIVTSSLIADYGTATRTIQGHIKSVKVTETQPPEHYIIVGNATQTQSHNGDYTFTFTNRRKPTVLVHHYFKQSDGTYTTDRVAPDEELEGLEGQSYNTSPK